MKYCPTKSKLVQEIHKDWKVEYHSLKERFKFSWALSNMLQQKISSVCEGHFYLVLKPSVGRLNDRPVSKSQRTACVYCFCNGSSRRKSPYIELNVSYVWFWMIWFLIILCCINNSSLLKVLSNENIVEPKPEFNIIFLHALMISSVLRLFTKQENRCTSNVPHVNVFLKLDFK